MSDQPFDDTQPQSSVELVMLFIESGLISVDDLYVFEQSDLPSEIGERDIMFDLDHDGSVKCVAVSSDFLKEIREAGYDI